MAKNIYEATANFSVDLVVKSLSSHANEFLEKVNESKYLSESQAMHLKQLETSESKISYLLRTFIFPESQAGKTNLFELLITFMKKSTDATLKSLAEKLVEERAVPTNISQEATEATELSPKDDFLVLEAENAATVPTQPPTKSKHEESTATVPTQSATESKHEELVASNGTTLLNQHVKSSMSDVTSKSNLLRSTDLDLEKVLKNNILSKVQISIVTCTGIPKTGKTPFSHLLMKSQPKDSSGDHSTIYIKKRKNIRLNRDTKWEKIELNKLIEKFKNYVQYKAEHEEIWSILIMLDISVPTPAIDLLPPSIITFITCVCTQKQQSNIESVEFSSFLNVLMSCNCFKTNPDPDRNSMFDKLIHSHCKDEKRCYTAFVGVIKTDVPKCVKANVNKEIKDLRDKLAHVRDQYPDKIPYPYWFVEDGGLLNSVDVDNPNDAAAEKLYSQMEKQLSDSIVYNIPITWLLLYFQILKICEDKEYVHYKTILDSVWKTMCISNDENELKTALSFFHYQEALLYFKDVDGICDYIFKDARWLFKKITFLLYHFPPTYRDFDAYLAYKRGILNKQMIFEVSCESDMKNDIKLGDILKLLVCKKFIAPLNRSGNTEYFIPGVLESFDSQSETKLKFASLQTKTDSLLVVFTCGSFHRLMFCQVAAYLLKYLPLGWSQPKNQNIFSNLITFPVGGVSGFGHVSFIDRIHFLEIQIHDSPNEVSSIEQHLVYRSANEALNNACAELGLNCCDLKFGFLCQYCSCSEEQHIMIMDKSLSKACCCITNQQITMLDRHLKWINENRAKTPMQELTSATTEMDSQSKEATEFNQEFVERDAVAVKGNKKRHGSNHCKTAPVGPINPEERHELCNKESWSALSEGSSLELLPTRNSRFSHELSPTMSGNSLQRFSTDIVQRVNPTEILPNLITKRLLTDAQQDTLSKESSTLSYKKQYLLCNVLMKFTEGSVDKFLECLKETSNYGPHDELLKIITTGNQATTDV